MYKEELADQIAQRIIALYVYEFEKLIFSLSNKTIEAAITCIVSLMAASIVI